MDYNQQSDAFYNDITKLVNRYKTEFDLTYMQLVGVLEMYKLELFCEAMAALRDNEDRDDDNDELTPFDFEYYRTRTNNT